MNKSILSVALVLSVLATGANAERLNLNLNAQGSLSRQADPRLADTRPARELREVRRKVTRTNANGETSQRSAIITRDPEAGVISHSVTGSTINGRSYSGESLFERTDDGFSGESSMTGERGETRTRSVDASVNKEAGSMTKTVNISGPNAQASTTTTVTRNQPSAAE